MFNEIKWLIIHHVGGIDSNAKASTQNQTFEQVNEYHRQKWDFKSSLGFFIGYHYFIDKSGKITQGRADTDEGAHCIGFNTASLGISLAGNFDKGVDTPTEAQINSLKKLLKEKQAVYNIPISNIVAHRKFAVKTCYGNSLTDTWARDLLGVIPLPPSLNSPDSPNYSQTLATLQLLLQKLQEVLKLRQARQTFGSMIGDRDVCE